MHIYLRMNSYVSKYKMIMHVHSKPGSGAAAKSAITENCHCVLVMVAGMRHEGSKTLKCGLRIQVHAESYVPHYTNSS